VHGFASGNIACKSGEVLFRKTKTSGGRTLLGEVSEVEARIKGNDQRTIKGRLRGEGDVLFGAKASCSAIGCKNTEI
jgi:hypothetical protein